MSPTLHHQDPSANTWTKMLLGLMSVWTSLASWMVRSPSNACCITARIWTNSKGPEAELNLAAKSLPPNS
jgi:hypothetical protein